MGRLEPLGAANSEQALAYLAERPYDNVYVAWLLGTRQIARAGDAAIWRSDDEKVAGFCYCGAQIVPQTDDDAALPAFAARLAPSTLARMIVGPRRCVEGFWAAAAPSMPRPVAIRASQPLYALDRRGLRGSRADANVQRASRDEAGEIAPHSARMIAGEVGGSPNRTAEFRLRTARIIEAGWWWRYRVDGKLAFMCNVGSATPFTAQLQGVWTPPEMRGKGYATRALAAICDRLLDEHPTLCLYVNDFNLPAIALYERVGFSRAGEFSTILF